MVFLKSEINKEFKLLFKINAKPFVRSRRSASETLCRGDLCMLAKKPSFDHRHHQLAFSASHTSRQAINPNDSYNY